MGRQYIFSAVYLGLIAINQDLYVEMDWESKYAEWKANLIHEYHLVNSWNFIRLTFWTKQ